MPTIAVDFDGVIHAYRRGWQDGSIYDEPVPGAFDAIRELQQTHAVVIFTARDPGIVARWLTGHGFACTDGIDSGGFWDDQKVLLVTNRKPAAVAYIDDRAIRFRSWPQVLADLKVQQPGHAGSIRPWWCQDPSCTPTSSDTGAQLGSFDQHPEYSGFCCGTVSESLEFSRHGQHHVNDGHLCFRSAIRGVVMLEINEGDLDSVCRVAMRGILARKPDREFDGQWYTGRDTGWQPASLEDPA